MRGALRKEVRLSYIRPTASCIVLRTKPGISLLSIGTASFGFCYQNPL